MFRPLKSVTYGQCEATYGYLPSRRASPPLASTKLYCMVTGTQGCEHLARSHITQSRPGRELNPPLLGRKSDAQPAAPLCHPCFKLLGRIAVLRTYMRPIVTDRVAWSVGLSLRHDYEPCKTPEPIKMPFGSKEACIRWRCTLALPGRA